MSSRYLQILSIGRPFPFNLDETGRQMFSCNYEATAAAPVGALEEEIVGYLASGSLASLGVDTFIGQAAIIPSGAGPWIQIIDTGGYSPMETHNGDKYERLGFQIVVRGADWEAARERALAIWRALDGQRNITLTA